MQKAPEFQTLEISFETKEIVKLTLNRPEVSNAINVDMMKELVQFWAWVEKNKNNLRCIILTGKGEKAFCAGADLKARRDISLAQWKSQHKILQKAMRAMVNCSIPVIAAVNGAAYGGGLELALASDFIYCAETAIFSQSEVKIGIIPGAMGTQHLPKACGMRRAKELCFTAESFSAMDALEWGIVNKVCKFEDLLAEALKTAKKITENAPIAIRCAKAAMNGSLHRDILAGYKHELKYYEITLQTKDREEGIKAFNEKRKPMFKNY